MRQSLPGLLKVRRGPPGRGWFALRAAACMGVPVLAGWLAGETGAGLMAATGGFTAVYGSGRPYLRFATNGRDAIHFITTEDHPRNYDNSIYHGSIKGGTIYGQTDEYGYKVVDKPVEIHDLHATMLYLLGVDHWQQTYHFSGRNFRLTDVHGDVVREVIA